MKNKIIFMYSGQGSQYFRMGKGLFDENPVFKKWMLKLDLIAQDYISKSIVNLIYGNDAKKSNLFDQTTDSSLAIYMVEYSLTQVLLENNIAPDYIMGSSLGEFCAASVAGVWSVEDSIKAVFNQAQIMEKNCSKGGMLAIIHNRDLFDTTPQLFENSEFASDNFDSHFVVSGKNEKLKEIEQFLRNRRINSQMLPVSHAFHSSNIDSAYSDFSEILGQQGYLPPQIPVISCLKSREISAFSADYLWKVIRNPIQFQNTIKNLENQGGFTYLDLGPSGTLSNFTKYNLDEKSKSDVYAVLTPFGKDVEKLEKILTTIKKTQCKSNTMDTNKMMKTYVFPGQGAQKKGMGKDLFNEFSELTEKADSILGYSIKDLCLEDRDNLLGNTRYTQPALYVVNALSYLKKLKETEVKPDFVAGHSLGEYNALFASGAFDFETGLGIVKKRGELMGQAKGGGMAAVIGLSAEDIEKILSDNGLADISIANLNTPTQIVVAGLKKDINDAKKIFEASGAKMYIPLNVSGAFHSAHMASAGEEFRAFMDKIEFSEMKIPVISNIHARPYQQNKIKETLVDQMTHSVKWSESICYLMGKGEMVFEEAGPGKVLTGLISKIEKEGEPIVIENEDELLVSSDEEPVKNKLNKKTDTDIVTQEKESMPGEKISETVVNKKSTINPKSLGNNEFKKDYNLEYAYVTGGMYKGIASKDLVVKAGKAGMLGYYGTGGVHTDVVENAITEIQAELKNGQAYGVNLLSNPFENDIIDLCLKHKVRNVEAAAYVQLTPAIVKFRLKGLSKNGDNEIIIANKIQAKISRPEIATLFLSPAPERIVTQLLETNQISAEEAELSKKVPMADDLCAEADSGGHTDQAVAYALLPAIMRLRDDMMREYGYAKKIRVGSAGGIGTPEAAAAAFIMGADFILTGSINQCTVEAATSDSVKDLLQQINVQDTEYAPAGDMFEFGAKVQVLKKSVFFPARANKLYSLYQHHNSLDELDDKTKTQLEQRYFKHSFNEIFEECREFYPQEEIEKANKNPKQKMAMIFKWYFAQSTQLALAGQEDRRVDYQIQCGPALGAFNQWVKGTSLEEWQNRHVDEIGMKLMAETSELLSQRLNSL